MICYHQMDDQKTNWGRHHDFDFDFSFTAMFLAALFSQRFVAKIRHRFKKSSIEGLLLL